jgi:hypothetical protein
MATHDLEQIPSSPQPPDSTSDNPGSDPFYDEENEADFEDDEDSS